LRNSDEHLIVDYVGGDEGMLSRLIEQHGRGVTRFAQRQLGSRRAWADDVTQNVFVRVTRAERIRWSAKVHPGRLSANLCA
jgi:DNA-directed RNA polymerase specialized sigma24 family protein